MNGTIVKGKITSMSQTINVETFAAANLDAWTGHAAPTLNSETAHSCPSKFDIVSFLKMANRS